MTTFGNFKLVLLLTVTCLLVTSFIEPPAKITVYLVGDSTIADKDPAKFPETGWGTPFKTFFDSTVVIENRARNGRSTRTFIQEDLWRPIADSLKQGDYVFIQFGHNDESKQKPDRYTTPEEYKRNLVRFVVETRARKAIPVLITPVTRRIFKDGKIQQTHSEYSPLVADVAAAQRVPLIDLDARSRALLESTGEEASKLFFLHLLPGEHPNYPDGKTDDTHFSETGARKIAQLVLADVIFLRLTVADRIVKPAGK